MRWPALERHKDRLPARKRKSSDSEEPLASAALLAEIVGEEPALAICHYWGGQTLFVPARAEAGFNPIRLRFGAWVAAELAEKYGGRSVRIAHLSDFREDTRSFEQNLNRRVGAYDDQTLTEQFEDYCRSLRAELDAKPVGIPSP